MAPSRYRRPPLENDVLQPILEESPVLRLHSAARARLVRRILGIIVMVLLIAAVAWVGWYAWALRTASSNMQGPMRDDQAAFGRLTTEDTDLTLLVVRPSGIPSLAVTAVLRQPEDGNGSWLLVLPAAPLPTSDAANETPRILLTRGRASLMKAVETLIETRFRHYVEVDGEALSAAVRGLSRPSEEESPTDAEQQVSYATSTTIAAVVAASEDYERLRNRAGPLGILGVPRLASALRDVSVSDLSATEADAVLRRLGSDAAEGLVQIAIAPTQQVNKKPVVSATTAGILATRMLQGQPFGTVSASGQRVAPETVSITVLNGAGREGVANQAARILRRAGYRVTTVGNANQFVYDATLVIYDVKKVNADSVASDLRLGRVVASRGMYEFVTDVLVIVGDDWPQAP